jgi:hypothetical protein
MKLLEEFQEQLAKIGPPRRVWLTTFNLGIEFVETYLLPAILGMEAPRSPMDFELMQQKLAALQAAGDGAGQDTVAVAPLDLRVFADRRMLSDSVERKRTSVAVTAVSPSRYGFEDESLFHPKVIYLEGADGRAIIGCGSANLTVGGWARNQEVFAFRAIGSDAQAAQVQAFFTPLLTAAALPVPMLAPKRWGADDNWSFCHSFQPAGLVEQLAEHHPADTGIPRLAVWSPYFSGNLAQLLEAVRHAAGNPNMPVHLVADRNDNNQIRTAWTTALVSELNQGTLHFRSGSRQIRRHEQIRMCHAKLWLTPRVIAIGSWNFTMPGAQMQDQANNIEAGMLLRAPPDFDGALGAIETVSEKDFCSTQQLADEVLQVPPTLPFEIRVTFDWRALRYTVCLDWLDEGSRACYLLHLPDLKPIELSPAAPQQAPYQVPEPRQLLSYRYYTVELDGATVARGIIDEQHALFRRGERFASLDDLLESLIVDSAGGAGPGTELRGEPDSDAYLIDEAITAEPPANAALSSYFRLFHAFQNYREHIQQCNSPTELQLCVMVRPGCLKEFYEKIGAHSADGNGVYHWFLVQEFNTLLNLSHQAANRWPDAPLPIDWPSLRLNAGHSDENTRRYMELIRSECNYD